MLLMSFKRIVIAPAFILRSYFDDFFFCILPSFSFTYPPLYQQANRWRKRGLSLVPTKFGISFTAKFMNQGGALVRKRSKRANNNDVAAFVTGILQRDTFLLYSLRFSSYSSTPSYVLYCILH